MWNVFGGVHVIFTGTTTFGEHQNQVYNYISSLINQPFFTDRLSQYGVAPNSNYETTDDYTSWLPTSENDIRTWLSNGAFINGSSVLNSVDQYGIFLFIVPPGNGLGQAFHRHIVTNNVDYKFAMVVDGTLGGGGANAFTAAISHELAETLASPDQNAYYSTAVISGDTNGNSGHEEVGDLCIGKPWYPWGLTPPWWMDLGPFIMAEEVWDQNLWSCGHFGSKQVWDPHDEYLEYSASNGSFAGDVTGDGKADLVLVGEYNIKVFPSTNKQFSSGTSWLGSSIPLQGQFHAGHFSNPSLLSLAALTKPGVVVYTPNPATSTFSSATQWTSANIGGSHGTLVGDVNGDGLDDLVELFDHEVDVELSTGTSFAARSKWATSGFWGPGGTYLADVNGDGYADLVAVGTVGGVPAPGISVRLATHPGYGFAATQTWSNASFNSTPAAIAAVDVDLDGRADLVAFTSNDVEVLHSLPQTGGASLPNEFSDLEVWLNTSVGSSVLMADVVGNHYPDIIALSDTEIAVYQPFTN